MYCKICNTQMNNVYSFYNGLAHKFKRCPKCHFESKENVVSFDDIPFKPTVVEQVKKSEKPKILSKPKYEPQRTKQKKTNNGYSIASILVAQKEEKDNKRKKNKK